MRSILLSDIFAMLYCYTYLLWWYRRNIYIGFNAKYKCLFPKKKLKIKTHIETEIRPKVIVEWSAHFFRISDVPG